MLSPNKLLMIITYRRTTRNTADHPYRIKRRDRCLEEMTSVYVGASHVCGRLYCYDT